MGRDISGEGMRRSILLGFSLMTTLAGCGNTTGTYGNGKEELKSAEVMIIRYGAKLDRILKFDDAKRLQPLLKELRVRDVNEGTLTSPACPIQILFILPKGYMVETYFVKRDQLVRSCWGLMYLADDKF